MRYGTLVLSELTALVDALGEEAVRLIAGRKMVEAGFEHPKYGSISLGQLEAFLNIAFRDIPLERLPDVLAGRLVPTWVEKARLVVDSTFRCTPDGLANSVLSPNTQFLRNAPATYDTNVIKERLARLTEFWPFKGAQMPSAEEVEVRYQAIMGWIKRPEHEENGIANLAQGPHYLGFMPQVEAGDLGAIAEQIVDASGRSYEAQFPGRSFTNHRKGTFAGLVCLADGVRYGQFVQKATAGAVVWVSFPCLQGFSIPAQRDQEARMPERFILGGVLDTATEFLMYPDQIASGFNTIGRDCSTNTWQSADGSPCFKARGAVADFGYGHLGAYDHCSGVLLVLG